MQSLRDIPIVKAAIAYNDSQTGETIILVINQALYFGSHLSHMLLNPNQMLAHRIIVDDIPAHLSTRSSHSIIVPKENVTIPLNLMGIISFFQARTPSMFEVENCRHIYNIRKGMATILSALRRIRESSKGPGHKNICYDY
jgi:hypothetical protein